MDFSKPFVVVPVPLNSRGEGPEPDPACVDKMVYEVWDANYQTVASYPSHNMANEIAEALNLSPHYSN